MLIRIGYDITLNLSVPTSVLFALRVHPSREDDLVAPENFHIDPILPVEEFFDHFGNHCGRISAPAGSVRFTNEAMIRDSGELDPYEPHAVHEDVRDLPLVTLPYILPSRYCEADSELLQLAWDKFGKIKGGWAMVQAVCDYVNDHLTFDYLKARATRSALDAYREKTGVCRDFTHLAITLCRCLNIPARYATGYLGDIGIPPVPCPMDFSAWFEVFLSGRWYTFDARHNTRRIGRIVMARGRDASDCALTTVFGLHTLENFHVVTDEVLQG
ncbi:transglutaminase family protein [soil metagenome]